MSFSSEVKQEICRTSMDNSQAKACLAALLLIRASLNLSKDGMTVVFQTQNASTAKFAYKLLRQAYDAQIQLAVCKKMNMKKNIYRLTIVRDAMEILEDLTIWRSTGLSPAPGYKLIRSEKNARAFLQGAFLASGSINHPKTTNYHLEIAVPDEALAACLQKCMDRFDFSTKVACRKQEWLVYMKAGDKIADFLRLLGASESLFSFENTRIARDFYNQITRLDNCELANEMKTLKAAKEQLEWIEAIESCPNIKVSDKVAHVMEARKQNPEASSVELCDAVYLLYGETISKSGMKHRLAKIKELASMCQKKEDDQ